MRGYDRTVDRVDRVRCSPIYTVTVIRTQPIAGNGRIDGTHAILRSSEQSTSVIRSKYRPWRTVEINSETSMLIRSSIKVGDKLERASRTIKGICPDKHSIKVCGTTVYCGVSS